MARKASSKPDSGSTSTAIGNLQQSRTLATLRNTLLPKLLSGELSIEKLDTE